MHFWQVTILHCSSQTILLPTDTELSALVNRIAQRIAASDADRVIVDSMVEVRLLARDSAHYRRQIIDLRQRLGDCQATVILLDDLTAAGREYELQSAVHGVVTLEQLERNFGATRRRLRVVLIERGAAEVGAVRDAAAVADREFDEHRVHADADEQRREAPQRHLHDEEHDRRVRRDAGGVEHQPVAGAAGADERDVRRAHPGGGGKVAESAAGAADEVQLPGPPGPEPRLGDRPEHPQRQQVRQQVHDVREAVRELVGHDAHQAEANP